MDTVELRKQAVKSIAAIQSNPFTRQLNLTPVVQVYSRQQVFSFPVKFKYLGCKDGRHIYNLDARQILQHLDRHELEFDLSAKQPLKNPLLRRVKRGLRVFTRYRP
jgi:hypothetical protein